MRQTHRAAAFMNWDRVSPPFVRNGTLYIPAAFVTHNGEALDEKTPLLRSQRSINREGLRLQKLLGDDEATAVVSNVGWEQEFFAMDRDAYSGDPVAAGRMLIGAQLHGANTDFNYFNRENLVVLPSWMKSQTHSCACTLCSTMRWHQVSTSSALYSSSPTLLPTRTRLQWN